MMLSDALLLIQKNGNLLGLSEEFKPLSLYHKMWNRGLIERHSNLNPGPRLYRLTPAGRKALGDG